MNGINRVYLLGNLGRDPELKYGENTSVLRLSLATTEKYKGKDGEWTERTDWHTVVMFGKRADALSSMLHKGSRLLVEGRIQTRNYDKDGEKKYVTEVVATNVVLLDSKGAPAEQSAAHDGNDDNIPF
jgi:single-strand DNA-binding protein